MKEKDLLREIYQMISYRSGMDNGANWHIKAYFHSPLKVS